MMSTPSTSTGSRSFVYISAADCFRPLIPAKYIETKRQAEFGIRHKVDEHPDSHIVPAFIRPGKSLTSRLLAGLTNRFDVPSSYPTYIYLTSIRPVIIRRHSRYTPYTQPLCLQISPRRSSRCASDPPSTCRSRRRGNHQSHYRGQRGCGGRQYYA